MNPRQMKSDNQALEATADGAFSLPIAARTLTPSVGGAQLTPGVSVLPRSLRLGVFAPLCFQETQV
jgi:hypothetical protein